MFSYRHLFHAGNHADVLKHIMLIAVLRYLTSAKETSILMVDTHAGAGLYRLDSSEAQMSQEAHAAIFPLWQQYGPGAPQEAHAPEALAAYLKVLAGMNPGEVLRKYPGSPAIAVSLLRVQDQLRLFELHPTDGRLLHNNMTELQGTEISGKSARIQVVRNNGFTGLKALLPPPSRRGLVLVDPSYELKSDYGQVITCVQDALRRFAMGCYMVWYPIIPRPEAHDLPRRLKTMAQKAGKAWLHASLSIGRGDKGNGPSGLRASGVFIINPPYVLQAQLQESLPVISQALKQVSGNASGSNWKVESES